jgi:hypothetical protein
MPRDLPTLVPSLKSESLGRMELSLEPPEFRPACAVTWRTMICDVRHCDATGRNLCSCMWQASLWEQRTYALPYGCGT